MGRFYYEDGTLVDTILSAKGSPRKVTVADVRKSIGTDKVMYPSVTTCTSLIGNDYLVDWKVKEALRVGYELLARNPDDWGNKDAFIDAAYDLFRANASETMAQGTEIHKEIELFLNGEMYNNSKLIENIQAELTPFDGKLLSELCVVSKEAHYAGTIDCLAIDSPDSPAFATILDFKSTNSPPKKAYDSWLMQLGAYTHLVTVKFPSVTSIATAIITINREDYTCGTIKVSPEDLKWGAQMFAIAKQMYFLSNKLEYPCEL